MKDSEPRIQTVLKLIQVSSFHDANKIKTMSHSENASYFFISNFETIATSTEKKIIYHLTSTRAVGTV